MGQFGRRFRRCPRPSSHVRLFQSAYFRAESTSLHSAKIDSPENDLPPSVPFRVSGFPTLKFKPAGTREFLDYEGDRSLDSLVAFVRANAKNSLEPKIQVEAEDQIPLKREGVDHVEL